MEIKSEYLQKYLYDIAVEQLSADYQAKGYQVSNQDKIGKFRPDLVARKGDEVIVMEVKAGKLSPDKRRQVAAIGDFVRTQKNYKFLLVLATPSKQKKIDIPNLNQLLLDYLANNFPQTLNALSSHTRITDVPDVVVHEVTLTEDGSIVAKGSGTVEVELQDGPENDGTVTEDVFPFNFDVILTYNEKHELTLADAEKLEVDVSSFYE